YTMNKNIITGVITAALMLPVMALAFNAGPIPATNPGLNVSTLIDTIFNVLWPILVAIIIIMFVLAGFMFLTARGDPDTIGKARQALIWGVAGVVVILLAWSITFVVRNQIGV